MSTVATCCSPLKTECDRMGPVTEHGFTSGVCNPSVRCSRSWLSGRATPCLLGLFSVIVLLAYALHPEDLPTPRAAWYPKTEPTFIDAHAAVRRHLWASRHRPTLGSTPVPADSLDTPA